MIGHVDADCFYVSAERVRFPHLEGLPVGVIGNHGACIIAKSYEAKGAGAETWARSPGGGVASFRSATRAMFRNIPANTH